MGAETAASGPGHVATLILAAEPKAAQGDLITNPQCHPFRTERGGLGHNTIRSTAPPSVARAKLLWCAWQVR